jgi:hypothetical protein
MLFGLGFSNEEGCSASVFSLAAAQLKYAATSALNIAHRSASWLISKALRFCLVWSMRLNEDDTVSISLFSFFRLLGGSKMSFSMEYIGGKFGFSHGGMDVLFFVADPAVPLDGNLRATIIRIQPRGQFDKQDHFVATGTWGGGNFRVFCKLLSFDTVGIKMLSEKDVSQLFEKLKVSPGAGHLSDGSATICVGQSDV